MIVYLLLATQICIVKILDIFQDILQNFAIAVQLGVAKHRFWRVLSGIPLVLFTGST
jgi:hypothetical protein